MAGQALSEARAKAITRAVRPEDLHDLLEKATTASLAFVRDGEVEAMPVSFAFRQGRYMFALPEQKTLPTEGVPVTLLIDEGTFHTELRGVRVRGLAAATEGSADWLEAVPGTVSAWDYGAMRRRR